MKNLLLIFSLSIFLSTAAQEISIIPKPSDISITGGKFNISSKTVIVANDDQTKKSADFLADYLKTFYGLKLPIQNKAPKDNFISLNVKKFIKQPDADGYSLVVANNTAKIDGDTYAGTFYGVQSLIQLFPIKNSKSPIPQFPIPNLSITDQPRFSYRGMHLDVSRHFFPVSFIKKYIDYLALYKFNTFHWHLTDDQGWRIEIKKYPKLTSVGAWRNGTIIGRYPGKGNDSIHYGGFYTQQEIKEIVKYAADRFISVIPEIEMPGHSSAAIAAYPELSCFPAEDTKVAKGTAWAGSTKGKQVQQAWGIFDDVFCAGKESTFQLLEGVLDEVAALFPSKYIHIGGDECPKSNWKRCPNCQQRIKDNSLKDEHQLQSYFIQRIEKYLNSKGKQIIGWDEILEGGLAPNATVMSWRGEQGGIDAAKQNHDVVMTPGAWCYFDKAQSNNEDSVTIGGYLPVEKVYSYDPVPKQLSAEEAKHILGAQANVWTEYIGNTRKVEYMIFPRIAALSEVLWTKKELKDSADFERRLESQFRKFDLWKVNYSNSFYEIKGEILPETNRNGILLKLNTRSKKDIQLYKVQPGFLERFGTKMISYDTFALGSYEKPVLITTSSEYFTGSSPAFKQKFYFNKATGKKITVAPQPSPTYPGNGGAFGLVNGIRADKFASQEWLGWTKPVSIGIELNEPDSLKEIVLHAWKQEASWIYLPSKIWVLVYDSEEDSRKHGDESTFKKQITNVEDLFKDGKISIRLENAKGKYVVISAEPLSKIPEGRQGAGNPAWMFLDEIEIN